MREPKPGIRRVLAAVATLSVIFFASWEGLQPPPPRPASAPADQFSAGRALLILARVLGDEAPHPVGSDANNAVRGRILEELTDIGYQPAIQTAFACSHYGVCATVNNIVARLEGGDETGVLLSAHYDSVATGPGASDDGVGVAAVLEVARALKHAPVPRHSIILLIDDGEEAGLLGARAFLDSNPLAKSVRAAVNLDARGTSGPSLLFETGSANAWAVRIYANRVRRPVTSSIFYTLYKRLPNDTDFTLFKDAGYQGFNFAFIGDVVRYHTPLDNLANVDPRSMQHQGDNALSSIIALANADSSNTPESGAVYFDLFQDATIYIGKRWNLALAILSALLVFIEITLLIRYERLALVQFARGLACTLTIIALAGILSIILGRFLRLASALPVNWIAHPLPVEVAFCGLAVSVVVTSAILFARVSGFWALWGGVWTWWSILSLILAGWIPGVSYLFTIPGAAAAICALPGTLGKTEPADEQGASWIVILPLAISAALGFRFAPLLYEELGNRALPAIAVLVALLLTPILPLCVDFLKIRGLTGLLFYWVPIAATALGAFATVVVPSYSAKSPEHVNILYWKDADTGKSQWVVQPASGRLAEPLAAAAMFQHSVTSPFPWTLGPAFLTPAPRFDAPAPTFTVLQSTPLADKRTFRALLRSERAAPDAMALFPPGTKVEGVRLNGYSVEPGGDWVRRIFRGWSVYRCLTTPATGLEITFTVPAGKPFEVYAADVTTGLPSAGKFLLDARPLTAAPANEGDVTLVTRRVQLIP